MTNILLLGPPGAGKGTVAQFLVESKKMKVLATGHMLRQAISDKTALGLQAKAIMDQGKLVSDSVMLDLVVDFIAKHNSDVGLVFDGFPRTIVQAEAMAERGIKLDLVVLLDVSDEILIKRMSGRRVHPGSGRVYHIENNPPKNPGLDDLTNEPLVMRADDDASVVKDRLAVYHDLTAPLINFYKESDIRFEIINAANDLHQVLDCLYYLVSQ